MQPLIILLGPTAVGKTELSIQFAKSLKAEIISADSRLFYRGMDVGTAKPDPDQLREVPHHLIDVSEPDDTWSLARYVRILPDIIDDISKRGKLPILVGGTGQYIRAVVEGWDLPGVKPDPELRRILELWVEEIGPGGLRKRLMVLDPEAADGIDGPNIRRMIRALEVIFSTGKTFTAQKGKQGTDYEILQLGLIRPREELYNRIDERAEAMIEAGFVKEVKNLIKAGYSLDLPAMSAIGYKQVGHYLKGSITLEEAVRQIKSRTRKYVRQQANWFAEDDQQIHWFNAGENPLSAMVQLTQQFLAEICYTENISSGI
jgi:tRNA dimethylallyltransferase